MLSSKPGFGISGRAIVVYFLLFGGPFCDAGLKRTQSRCFNGVVATFKIENPIVRIGDNLRVVVIYRNTASRSIKFRFAHLDNDMEVYQKGKVKPIIGGFAGEAPYEEVTLKPGESFRSEDELQLKGWPELQPGEYEIQFAYHLGLLSDNRLIRHYQAIYPHNEYLVAWSDRRFSFRLVR